MTVARTGWVGHVWDLMARLDAPLTDRRYVVRVATVPGLVQVWRASPSWTWELEASTFEPSFPGRYKPLVVTDPGYGLLNADLTEDW